MFKPLAALALVLSLVGCAAEPAAETASTSADIVQAEPGADRVITVVAIAKVRPETLSDFKTAAEDLVRGTRLEDGNVSYTMLESKDDPNELIFIEEWESQSAIDAHMNGPVLGTFFGLVKDDFLAGYPQITETDTVAVAQKGTGTTVAR